MYKSAAHKVGRFPAIQNTGLLTFIETGPCRLLRLIKPFVRVDFLWARLKVKTHNRSCVILELKIIWLTTLVHLLCFLPILTPCKKIQTWNKKKSRQYFDCARITCSLLLLWFFSFQNFGGGEFDSWKEMYNCNGWISGPSPKGLLWWHTERIRCKPSKCQVDLMIPQPSTIDLY